MEACQGYASSWNVLNINNECNGEQMVVLSKACLGAGEGARFKFRDYRLSDN